MTDILIRIFYTLRMFLSRKSGWGNKILLNEKDILPVVPFYKISVYDEIKEVNFEEYKGSKILIVNLASKCGYTPQYEELEQLHRKFSDHVKVIGFPSNNFKGQEPGTDTEIKNYCKVNYGVTFHLFPKGNVVGNQLQSVYEWLSDPHKNGWNSQLPKWNFYKYLIDEKGGLIGVYSSAVSPLSDEIIKAVTNEK